MKNITRNQPPRLPLAFFRWYCHPDLREEIEGDLLEYLHKQTIRYGSNTARFLFSKEVILLFRPGIVGNFSLRHL